MKRIMNKNYDDYFLGQINFILETIKNLDRIFYKKLCDKYSFVKDLNNSYLPDNVTNLVYDLGIYIVSKVNKSVSGETIFKGIREIYKHSYGYKKEDLDDVLDKVREYNKVSHSKFFPVRYKINDDGNKADSLPLGRHHDRP